MKMVYVNNVQGIKGLNKIKSGDLGRFVPEAGERDVL